MVATFNVCPIEMFAAPKLSNMIYNLLCVLLYSQNRSVFRRKVEKPLAQIRGGRARDPFNSNANRYKVCGETATSDILVSFNNCKCYIMSFMLC